MAASSILAPHADTAYLHFLTDREDRYKSIDSMFTPQFYFVTLPGKALTLEQLNAELASLTSSNAFGVAVYDPTKYAEVYKKFAWTKGQRLTAYAQRTDDVAKHITHHARSSPFCAAAYVQTVVYAACDHSRQSAFRRSATPPTVIHGPMMQSIDLSNPVYGNLSAQVGNVLGIGFYTDTAKKAIQAKYVCVPPHELATQQDCVVLISLGIVASRGHFTTVALNMQHASVCRI